MNKLLVSYDLRKPGRDYSTLYALLQTGKAVRVLESVWLLRSDFDADFWRNRLRLGLDVGDGLIVVEIDGTPAMHGINPTAMAWVNAYARS